MDVSPDALVEGQVYIGSKESAANPEILQQLNIKNVIVCCTTIPMYLENQTAVKYLRLAMNDSLD